MTPFWLLLLAFALLHLPLLRRWPGGPAPADKAAGALGLVLALTGTLHFTRTGTFVAMMPPFLPAHRELVLASGAAELLIALGLLVPRARRAAGWASVALFLAVWPANVWVAWSGEYPASLSPSPLYHALRVPFQLLYVAWGAWCGLGHFPGARLRRRAMAAMYDRTMAEHEAFVTDRKRELFRNLSGTVLELGPGTGVNLEYLPKEAGAVRWIGVEPSPYMRAKLAERARRVGIATDVRDLDEEAGRLPADDASVDVVVSTLVLCSVPDLAGTLREIRRVLKPGGRFVFLEHVAAPPGTWTRRFQRLLRPLWQFLADGCHPDRETEAAVRAAGFAGVEVERFRLEDKAAALVAPHVAGVAVR